MKAIFSIVGIILGAWIGEWENEPFLGAVFGFFIGLLSGTLLALRNRIREMEEDLKQLRDQLKGQALASSDTEPSAEEQAPVHPSEASTEIPDTHEPVAAPEVRESVRSEEQPTAYPSGDSATAGSVRPPILDNPVLIALKRFITGGNLVVKVGILLLFFGVSFLVKYAAEREIFPIELRLAAIATGAIILLIIGWRLRRKNANYALVLQGGAVGILYLTGFAAARLYAVLPLELGFLLLLGLVIFSSLLAIIQDARWLAVFATAGGFLAPILTSSGAGDHVILFSYYALLNAGILGIAWYKSWRLLNLVGFVFTFVIGALWGIDQYQPAYFSTTEPFLILFFLYYVAIAVLYAHRQPPRLKGLVDGTIVFGTPLVGFTLQLALVREFPFGAAYSALGVGALYIALASVLWRRQVPGMRMLTEAFLALGVIFLSIAIPFALDERWTAAAWALEGAGITWVGIRQHRLSPRLFGLLLQAGASIAFLMTIGHPHGNWPVFNSDYIGSVMIAIAGLFLGWQYFKGRETVTPPERDLHYLLLLWGLGWWLGAGLMEIEYHLAARYELNASLLFIALSLLVLDSLAVRLSWPAARWPAGLLLVAMVAIGLLQYLLGVNPFADGGFIAWLIALSIEFILLFRLDSVWRKSVLEKWHAGSLYVLIFVFTWVAAHAVSHYISGLQSWGHVIWGLLPALAVFTLITLRDQWNWPLKRYAVSYLGTGLVPIMVYLGVWVIAVCFRAGDPSPLPFLPVINPQDVAQLFALLAVIEWLARWRKQQIPSPARLQPAQVIGALAAVFFIWLNALVARTVHFYGMVPYQMEQMFASELFQTSISIVWTVAASILMIMAHRLALRKAWLTGAGLLAAVVLKLFLIDLADSGTITRIISFMGVGGLMLVIGYFTPMPPKSGVKTA